MRDVTRCCADRKRRRRIRLVRRHFAYRDRVLTVLLPGVVTARVLPRRLASGDRLPCVGRRARSGSTPPGTSPRAPWCTRGRRSRPTRRSPATSRRRPASATSVVGERIVPASPRVGRCGRGVLRAVQRERGVVPVVEIDLHGRRAVPSSSESSASSSAAADRPPSARPVSSCRQNSASAVIVREGAPPRGGTRPGRRLRRARRCGGIDRRASR